MMRKNKDMYAVVSVRDANAGHEAHNLFVSGLAETVRPWFEDVEDERISRALDDLTEPRLRGRAAKFLGLEISTRSPMIRT